MENTVVPFIHSLNRVVPVSSGGLGQPPQRIGAVLGSFGLVSGVVQLTVFPRMNKRFGSRRLFIASICGFFVVFPSFIVMHRLALWSVAKASSPGILMMNEIEVYREAIVPPVLTKWVWVVLAVQLASSALIDMGYGMLLPPPT